jgi:hypothetical protein
MMKRLLFSMTLTAFLVICLASIPATGQEKRRLPYRYLIPEGYVGWVRIDFNVKDAPPLPVEDGYYLLKIPLTGRLKTSSRPMEIKGEQYYYFSDSARHRLEISTLSAICMVRNPFIGAVQEHDTTKIFRYIYIGPKSSYEKYKLNEPSQELEEDGYPKVGPKAWLTEEELEQLMVKHP